MKIKKIGFVFALIVLLLSTDLFSLISYANSEKSETVKLTELNVKNIKNGEYTHEIELPKDFGEFINYTFDKTGQHTATGIKSVVYDANSNKLLVTFTMGTGKVNDVNGYRNGDKGLFKANPYNAVCRYSDGARWQINEFRMTDLLPVYTIYDLSSATNPVPTEFVFDKYRVNGKTTLNYKNENVGHWVDRKGTTYSNDQIDNTTKTVNQNALKFPKALDPKNIDFSKFTQADPSLAYNYLTANLDDVINSDDRQAAWLNPSSAKPQSALTGHAKCQQYEYQFEYYVSAKTKPVHNFEGTFTYRYKATDEAKIITTIEANPAQTKFNGQDVTVEVTLKAEVMNVQAGAVKNFKLFLRTEDNTQNPQPLGYIKNGNSLTAQVMQQFTIPSSKLSNKDEYKEYFVGRAYACFTNKADNECLMSDLVKTSSLVYKQSPVKEDESNHEIVAMIQGNQQVKVGDNTTFSSFGSYSTNSTIEGYRWVLPNAMEQPSDSYVPGEVSFMTWYNKVGTERAVVNVIDAEGRQAGAWLDFEVVEPTIEVTIGQSGTPKENRKVTFNANISTPTRYPVSKIKWKVQSLNGDLDTHIKHQPNLDDLRTFDALFKKSGEYLVTVDVENTAGYINQATYVIEIVEDKKPVAAFELQDKVYRDPKNNNMATFELTDYSYSFDGDYIKERKWYVIFDANNDGVFNEQRVLFNSGNNTKVTYQSNHVGKYLFLLEVTEEFGEPTIEQYVTAADRRKTSTDER